MYIYIMPIRPSTGDSDCDDGDIYQLCPCLPCCPVIRGANPPTSENAKKKNTLVR